jgi:hypothetical protein
MNVESRSMILRSIRVDRNQIGYLKWLLESHDGMATPTTRDGEPDVVDLLVAPDFIEEFDELLTALEREIGIERVPSPERPPL